MANDTKMKLAVFTRPAGGSHRLKDWKRVCPCASYNQGMRIVTRLQRQNPKIWATVLVEV